MSSTTKRKEIDLMKLMMNNFKVETIDDSVNEFFVYMNGPPNSKFSKPSTSFLCLTDYVLDFCLELL
ncbi:hypothetical protein HanXRQr2_Chr13g0619291 [Helianthus annuus]|uniref:Uncharacterized protein n=1 Tax=Helianthus annuus TaxID=4232 RepID=A0A9K3HE91_HELAN|nr:hypothetical protein HanXRQr2_Chr13g0619291 [Helianthus annuus]KAJ0499797.1 hypothetical protein HanHA89_Chr13g0537891 [Helianthus annuus]KAJ0665873.1 hypothetical protein HanLR1_Chr13g0508501 [Helianthus annuus]KAJ0851650.1 hypothetical protein HanPSC8_Chr13g0594491 [Helianthus annuus]